MMFVVGVNDDVEAGDEAFLLLMFSGLSISFFIGIVVDVDFTSLRVAGRIGVAIGAGLDKESDDNETSPEEILLVPVGVVVAFIFWDIVVVIGIGDAFVTVVDNDEEGVVEEGIEVIFMFEVDVIGRVDLAKFSATDFKFEESANKKGNNVEGKIGGTLKLGLLCKAVDIVNEGIVVGNGKLANGAIGFGTILATVVEEVVILDIDIVEAKGFAFVVEFDVLEETTEVLSGVVVEEVEVIVLGVIVEEVVVVLGVVVEEVVVLVLFNDGNNFFVDNGKIDETVFGEGLVASIGVGINGINGLVVDFFDCEEIEDEEEVGNDAEEIGISDFIDFWVIDFDLIRDSEIVEVAGIIGRSLGSVERVEWVLVFVNNDVGAAVWANDFIKDGEETGELILVLVLFEEIDEYKEEGKISLILFFESFLENILSLLLEVVNEEVFFWIGLCIILFNKECDFEFGNFNLLTFLFCSVFIEELLVNDDRGNFDILDEGGNSLICSFGSLMNSDIVGELTKILSVNIFVDKSSSINWSFVAFGSFDELLGLFDNFGDAINIFKRLSE